MGAVHFFGKGGKMGKKRAIGSLNKESEDEKLGSRKELAQLE
jgi:hypothetical protein